MWLRFHCLELWDPLSCCPTLEVTTGCTTVVGAFCTTCSTCTGAGNLRGVAYEVQVSVMPYGCTPSPWCAGSKGWTHLTLLLLENWWPHMPQSRGHGNRCCVNSSHAICCGFTGFPAVCADSHWRPLEVERTAVLTKICFCALVVAMDAEGSAIHPKSIETTFAAVETSPMQTFWVSAKSLWSGTNTPVFVALLWTPVGRGVE